MRYWANHDPNVEIDCKHQRRRGIMYLADSINGEVILHWFNVGTIMWPRISGVSNRKRYLFQQDGATHLTVVRVREWLTSKFGERVKSRFTEKPWVFEYKLKSFKKKLNRKFLLRIFIPQVSDIR